MRGASDINKAFYTLRNLAVTYPEHSNRELRERFTDGGK